MDYSQLLFLLAPETIITVTVFVLLLVDLTVMANDPNAGRRLVAALISSFGLILAMCWLCIFKSDASLAGSVFVANPLNRWAKIGIIVLTLFSVWLSSRSPVRHVGEFYSLLLFGCVGMLFISSAENLLLIFIALELTSLSLYLLTAFNKTSAPGAAAALKYFFFGGISAAFTLYGFSLIYGFAGAVSFVEINSKLKHVPGDLYFWAGLLLALTGFGFKVAAAPFHLWAPDAYEHAPTPAAAFIASVSKLGSFYVLAKLALSGLASAAGSAGWQNAAGGWMMLIATLAAASLLVGNLAALAQANFKRLIAFSAIAHAGYVLVGILGKNSVAFPAMLYYIFTYGLSALGAFAIAISIEEKRGSSEISSFAGLCSTAPVKSVCLVIFMLSLAGVPPLPGFFGKFYLFAGTLSQDMNLLWLVALAFAMSAVSLYYYLLVLKQAYVRNQSGESTIGDEFNILTTTTVVLAALVLVTGLYPGLITEPLILATKAILK